MKRFLVLVIFSLFISSTLACSCRFIEGEIEEQVEAAFLSASAVVLARVESIEALSSYGEEIDEDENPIEFYLTKQRTQFVEIKSWKGNHGKRFFTEVEVICCLCGFSFSEGEEYLLYLSGPNEYGYFHASSCSRTKLMSSDVEREMEILDKVSLRNP